MTKKSKFSKLNKFLIKLTLFFAGSWWGVGIHIIWFSLWIYFKLDLLTLTLVVSLEAIFIGIFILMAEAQEARLKEEKEKRIRQREHKVLNEDLKSDIKTEREVKTIKKEIREIKKMIEKEYK